MPTINTNSGVNSTVRAPFNFVPLPSKVYFPDWADSISHDVPFSDGVSGTISITITAETPIFVRNGAPSRSDDADQSGRDTRFSQDMRGRYFLPGSSIKGSIRQVLEILSFGKMRLDKRAMFARRDLAPNADYPLKDAQRNVLCGYLYQDGEDWMIENYGRPGRISHPDIDKLLGVNILEQNFKKGDFKTGKELTDDQKTAAFKYHLIEEQGLSAKLKCSLSEDKKNTIDQIIYRHDEYGSVNADIVLTGQPDKWKPRPMKGMGGGKYYEFVFVRPDNVKSHKLSSEKFEHHKFIYSQNDKGGQYNDWKRISKMIDDGVPVPVFFRLDENKKEVIDFGFAYLYKQPYDRSPFDTLPDDHKGEGEDFRPDLAECIFGFINKDKSVGSLKGRVQFSNAFAKRGKPDSTIKLTPGSPKASYYPIYVKQKAGGNPYDTYDKGDIRGWKQYVLRQNNVKPDVNNENEKVNTEMTPLMSGAEFACTVSFFNLRPVELGALLSALTFHDANARSRCRHQIGGGKPYGFGKVRIEIPNGGIKIIDGEPIDIARYLSIFENEMEAATGSQWRTSQTIKEFFAMHSFVATDADKAKFEYMKLNVENKDANEFVEAKKQKSYLRSFTEVAGVDANKSLPKSLKEIMEEELKKDFLDWREGWKQAVDAILAHGKITECDINDLCVLAFELSVYEEDFVRFASRSEFDQEADRVVKSVMKYYGQLIQDADELPQVTIREIDLKRERAEALKKDIDVKKAKYGGSIAFNELETQIGAVIGKIPAGLSSSITSELKFTASFNAFKNKLEKWLKQMGPISSSDAQALAVEFAKLSDKDKKKNKFDGGKPVDTVAKLLSDHGQPDAQDVAAIIFGRK